MLEKSAAGNLLTRHDPGGRVLLARLSIEGRTGNPQQYFEKEQENLEASNKLGADHLNTNLDFNEFWDDVDID